MPNAIIHIESLTGRIITGSSPQDIQERLLPRKPEQPREQDLSSAIAEEVVGQRETTGRDPNQQTYFTDVMEQVREKYPGQDPQEKGQ